MTLKLYALPMLSLHRCNNALHFEVCRVQGAMNVANRIPPKILCNNNSNDSNNNIIKSNIIHIIAKRQIKTD